MPYHNPARLLPHVRRSASLAAALLLLLALTGCGSAIETMIAAHYPRQGSVVDNTLLSGAATAGGRYHGTWYVSRASVPDTARQIAALRRPASMTPVNPDQMALRYDGWGGRVVMIHRAKPAAGGGAAGQTVIEVLQPRHAYYRYYPFMVGSWGGSTPYYRRYGQAYQRQYGYNTVTVGNDGTVRRSTVSSSTGSFRGGGPGFGK